MDLFWTVCVVMSILSGERRYRRCHPLSHPLPSFRQVDRFVYCVILSLTCSRRVVRPVFAQPTPHPPPPSLVVPRAHRLLARIVVSLYSTQACMYYRIPGLTRSRQSACRESVSAIYMI